MLLIQAPAQSGFERWANVTADLATIVIALALIVGGAVAIYGALKVRGMIRRVRGDFDPAIRNLTAASESAKAVSAALRTNVEELSGTVSDTNAKVRRATEAAEARLLELHALLEVMQREAEEIFIRAGSAVRGVQVGVGALRALRRRGGGDAYDGGLDEVLDDEAMDREDHDLPEIHVTRTRRTGRDIFD
ncbi:MAG TPA: hypothetical protein VFR37_13690 [Longimicrobium sp.]|nr:hypothetical protein [Longimicrobium sp.]